MTRIDLTWSKSDAIRLEVTSEGLGRSSLIPRHLRRGRRNAWYRLFVHVLISKPISKSLWAIGYSGNLPCTSDVTSLKFLLPQVAFSIMTSTTFRGLTFSDAVSYALKQLQMSQVSLKPEQRSSMEAIYDGHDVFMWLPTGYGKSLCFQALPFLMDFKRGLVDTWY